MQNLTISIKLTLIVSILFLINACNTGRKALQKGQYDLAVQQAVKRLQSKPDQAVAINTLQKAYPMAVDLHLTHIKEAKLGNDFFKWEKIVTEYEQINNLTELIKHCPTCLNKVALSNKFIPELYEAKQKAAEIRYDRGIQLLNEKKRESAKQAYFDFEKSGQFIPEFRDAKEKMEEAYWLAVLKVVVEPIVINSNTYKLSAEYFQNQLNEYMNSYERNSFIKFYYAEDAEKQKIIPDQILHLSFDDFQVGQTYVKENTSDISKNNIEVGQTTDKKPIYGTAKARFTRMQKTVTSSGILDFKIIDWQSKNVLTQEKLGGTYLWNCEWAFFNGDERALTRGELALTAQREQLPPPPQMMFTGFTNPIYTQFVFKIRDFYKRY